MAKARGGKAVPVIPFSAPKGTNSTANPWNLNIPGLKTNDGHGGTVPVPATAAGAGAAAAGGAGAAAAGTGPHDAAWWATILGMDPGYTQATAAADAAIANLNEQFNGPSPYSTVHQLDRSLGQNLRTNANSHVASGTLFSGGTAQGASNVNRDNQQARYNAQSALNNAIAQQNNNKASAAQSAMGNVMAHPDWYGIANGDTAPDPGPGPGGGAGAGAPAGSNLKNAPAPPPNPYLDGKSVNKVKTIIKNNSSTAWKT